MTVKYDDISGLFLSSCLKGLVCHYKNTNVTAIGEFCSTSFCKNVRKTEKELLYLKRNNVEGAQVPVTFYDGMLNYKEAESL